jgi:hypothetical protein
VLPTVGISVLPYEGLLYTGGRQAADAKPAALAGEGRSDAASGKPARLGGTARRARIRVRVDPSRTLTLHWDQGLKESPEHGQC